MKVGAPAFDAKTQTWSALPRIRRPSGITASRFTSMPMPKIERPGNGGLATMTIPARVAPNPKRAAARAKGLAAKAVRVRLHSYTKRHRKNGATMAGQFRERPAMPGATVAAAAHQARRAGHRASILGLPLSKLLASPLNPPTGKLHRALGQSQLHVQRRSCPLRAEGDSQPHIHFHRPWISQARASRSRSRTSSG